MNMHPQFRDHQSLLTRIDILEEENRQLRDQLAKVTGRNDTMVARQLFGLTESEARIFMLLLRCGEAEYGLMQDAVYSDGRLEEIEDPAWAIRAHMKRMRSKTRPLGIDFETIYSFGFRMSDAARATARRLLGGGTCHT